MAIEQRQAQDCLRQYPRLVARTGGDPAVTARLLAADLPTRTPGRCRAFDRRPRAAYAGQLRRAAGRDGARPVHPVPGPDRDADLPAIAAPGRRYEGDAAAQVAAGWLERGRPGALLVCGAAGAVLGVALLVAPETADAADPGAAAAPPETVAEPEATAPLAEPAFAASVRAALRDCTSPDLLRDNPLTRSWLVAARAGRDAPAAARGAALRALLEEAIGGLGASPRRAKLRRALHHTYLEPAGSQERVAEQLELPLTTYRDHLRAGLRLVGEILWRREADAGAGAARPAPARSDARGGDEGMAIEPAPRAA